jgi:hypothetical protein
VGEHTDARFAQAARQGAVGDEIESGEQSHDSLPTKVA